MSEFESRILPRVGFIMEDGFKDLSKIKTPSTLAKGGKKIICVF